MAIFTLNSRRELTIAMSIAALTGMNSAYAFPGYFNTSLCPDQTASCIGCHSSHTSTFIGNYFTNNCPQVNELPVAVAGGPYIGTVSMPLTFDGSGSSDSDGTIVSYNWDFGDGSGMQYDIGATPSYTYASEGNYSVTLTVTDDQGDSALDNAVVTIVAGNMPPVANAGGPYTGTVLVPLTFDGSGSSDTDGSIVNYLWNFNDGNVLEGADLINPVHTFENAGTYNVTLTVTDSMGDSATDSVEVSVGTGNQPPVADAGGPYVAELGQAVTFDGSSSIDPDGSITNYNWDFGDGSFGSGANPSHTYTMAGTYNVSLEVMDGMGAVDSASRIATITEPVVPVTDLDIKRIQFPKRVASKGKNPGVAAVKLVVTDNGNTPVIGTATLNGMINGTEVCASSITIDSSSLSRSYVLECMPGATGELQLSVSIDDGNDDDDFATTVINIK